MYFAKLVGATYLHFEKQQKGAYHTPLFIYFAETFKLFIALIVSR